MSDTHENRNQVLIDRQAALDQLDARVYVAIIDVIATAVYPGIRRPRGYALRHEVDARLTDVDPREVWSSICTLLHAGKIGHYYDRDGMRIFLKGTTNQ